MDLNLNIEYPQISEIRCYHLVIRKNIYAWVPYKHNQEGISLLVNKHILLLLWTTLLSGNQLFKVGHTHLIQEMSSEPADLAASNLMYIIASHLCRGRQGSGIWISTAWLFCSQEDKILPEEYCSSFLPSPHAKHLHARLSWTCMCMGR